jgi:hypothetical protein
MPKKRNYGQKPLPGVEEQIEAETAKNEQPIGGMPALELIKTYMAGLGLSTEDAEAMYDHWLANGFRLRGGNRIKDWRAVIRNWSRNEWFPSQKKAAKATEKLAEQEARQKAAIRRMKGGGA